MQLAPDWSLTDPAPGLDADELRVWLAPANLPPERVAALAAELAPDELARAARFHFERDRVRYIAARGSLRRILAGCAGVAPARLRFDYSPYGKPSLAPTAEMPAPPAFNISHSGEWALVAVRRAGRVGVDIEVIRPELARESIAERFFSPAEVAALRSLPAAEQGAAFFRCWTRKEAFVKARGEGLALPLDAFDVSLLPGEPPALLRLAGDAAAAAAWSMHSPPAPAGYAAAVVVDGALGRIRLMRFTETS